MQRIEIDVLNKIVEKEGDCLSAEICLHCPFKEKCLPSFLNKETIPSKIDRYHSASSTLAQLYLIETSLI